MSGAVTRRPVLYGDLRSWALIQADSLQLLRRFPTASVDAVVTDPPYAIGFGGEEWDGGGLIEPLGFQAFCADWAAEVKRILKPGGHLAAFGSPRTFHRMVAGCEDIGLEIRDQLLWLHGRGVPKSRMLPGGVSTTLKPAYEPIILARVPLAAKTTEHNIERYGTGGLNIEKARLPRAGQDGYWPSHIILSHNDDCRQSEECAPGCAVTLLDQAGSTGGEPLSRLFFAGKTDRVEREAGLEDLRHGSSAIFDRAKPLKRARANVHPTVKPISVMRWLVRLIAPPGGLVLDPFAGSASTGCAAVLEGRRFIGVEREARYLPIAKARLDYWTNCASAGPDVSA
jgi:DNA modification methylase